MGIGQSRATRIAVIIGQVAAVAFGLLGLFTGNFSLIVLAVFPLMAGTQEGQVARAHGVLEGVRVNQVRIRPALAVAPYHSLVDIEAVRLADLPVRLSGQ